MILKINILPAAVIKNTIVIAKNTAEAPASNAMFGISTVVIFIKEMATSN